LCSGSLLGFGWRCELGARRQIADGKGERGQNRFRLEVEEVADRWGLYISERGCGSQPSGE
jgi:hypothetical protein